MEKVLELISKEVGDAFEAAGYDRELEGQQSPTDLIFANISVTEPFREQRSIIKRRWP